MDARGDYFVNFGDHKDEAYNANSPYGQSVTGKHAIGHLLARHTRYPGTDMAPVASLSSLSSCHRLPPWCCFACGAMEYHQLYAGELCL
jgi:hypothetical protein